MDPRGVAGFLLWACVPAQERVLPPGPRAPGLRELVAAIEEAADGFEVVEVITDLGARYGTFADLDGDGDLDYVATEMSHRVEAVELHLRQEDGRWRRTDRTTAGLRGKHPFRPWVVADLGNGRPCVLVPTGWPPYLLLLPTDGRGHFAGRPVSLEPHLPARVSRPLGVDNCPYTVTGVEPAGADAPAAVHGTMEDGDEVVQFEIQLDPLASEVHPAPEDRIDWDAIPVRVQPSVREVGCRREEHGGRERRAIMATRILDLNGDRVEDLVHFTGDFAAHVFLGRTDAETGDVVFGEELPHCLPVPTPLTFHWLPDRMKCRDEDGGFAYNAADVLTRIGFRVLTPEDGDARVVMFSDSRFGKVVSYYWLGDRLVPVLNEHENAPPDPERGIRYFSGTRESVQVDADGDGTLDHLYAMPCEAVKWLKPYEEPEGVKWAFPGVDYRSLGKDRYSLFFWNGEAGMGDAVKLYVDPVATGVIENRHMGLPLEIETVRIMLPDGDPRERICIYLRDEEVGVFVDWTVEVSEEEANRRSAEAWLHRGLRLRAAEKLQPMCDLEQARDPQRCVFTDGARDPRGLRAAILMLDKAFALAPTPELRGRALLGRARCHSLLRNEAAALDAYRQSFAQTGRLDPLDRPHPDLAWLFARPRFREWHAGVGGDR